MPDGDTVLGMSGVVEWAVLIFLAGIAGGSMWIAWVARGMIARYELKYDLAIASLSNAIQDRNFLIKYDLALAELTKDSSHAQAHLDRHAIILRDVLDRLIWAEAELKRCSKIGSVVK
jgi:hypothetical protein